VCEDTLTAGDLFFSLQYAVLADLVAKAAGIPFAEKNTGKLNKRLLTLYIFMGFR
jgi:hypothetical protein